jgi:hypothetical protein
MPRAAVRGLGVTNATALATTLVPIGGQSRHDYRTDPTTATAANAPPPPGATSTAQGLPDLHLKQDIVSLKWRFAGLVRLMDDFMPGLLAAPA